MFEATIPLKGAGGEPVDLRRTLASHGVAELPPMAIDHEAVAFTVTLPTARSARSARAARTVTVRGGRGATVTITSPGRGLSAKAAQAIVDQVRTILHLDADLSEFYALAREDPSLAWAATGAGRMIRSATVFEEVIKTICTTNCAWGATERMAGAIVEHLGTPAPGAPKDSPMGRAFPTPEAMASAGEDFYRSVARAGYRASSFEKTATMVATGEVDLEALGSASPEELSDEAVEEQLLRLPGVGPYAAAHVMMMLGRSSKLILDSWTRPTYAAVIGAKKIPADRTIERRFRSYGRYAGLAFWLTVTRSWIEGDPEKE